MTFGPHRRAVLATRGAGAIAFGINAGVLGRAVVHGDWPGAAVPALAVLVIAAALELVHLVEQGFARRLAVLNAELRKMIAEQRLAEAALAEWERQRAAGGGPRVAFAVDVKRPN